jgi:hypothetical protein
MGFTINEPISFPNLNISIPNCYVTLKGKVNISKAPHVQKYSFVRTPKSNSPYVVYAQYFIYSGTNTLALDILKEDVVYVELSQFPTVNVSEILYDKLKTTIFQGKTFTDC